MSPNPVPDPDLHSLPDLFVLGRPKCGTTSLHAWPSRHPDVYPPAKGPNFLSRNVFASRGVPDTLAGWSAYLSRFMPLAKAGKLAADFTPRTLYSDFALDILADHPAAPRLIALLRNPVDLVFSLHGQMLRQGVERETDFVRAWETAKARGVDPDAWRDNAGRIDRRLDYPMFGLLGTRLQAWQARVPADRLKVLVLEEDITHAPQRAFAEVLEFLGLAPQPIDLTRRNERVALRSASIHRAMVRLRQGALLTRAAVGQPVRHGTRRGTGLMQLVNRFNLHKPDSALSPDLRARLAADLADEFAKVEAVLGRPVAAWRNWSGTAAAAPDGSLS